MQETRTTCPYCGVGCGIIASTDEAGQVSIKGDPTHPANYGRLCSKGAALGETLGLEERLLRPEVDGQSCDWDSALDAVADRFRAIIDQHGPDAVAFYVSGQLLTEDYYIANKLMKGYIGSANIDTNSRLCMSSAVAAYKRAFGADSVPCSYEDIEQAELIVLAGSNAAWCHPVVYQRIVAAKKTNPDLRVVVIDPRRTATCDIADLHLSLEPGSDALLFNGLLQYLAHNQAHDTHYTTAFTEDVDAALAAARDSSPDIDTVAEQCRLNAETVRRFYELFRHNEKVVTFFSQGINQSSSGTDKGNAIINCHLLTGRLGRPGMGPFSLTGQPNAMGGREVGGLANQLAAHMAIDNPTHRDLVQNFWQSPRMVTQVGRQAVDLFEAIHRGEIKAVWIMATNPVVSMPDADRVRDALAQCELVVVSDNMAHTDTLELATIKLPALGWGEKDGTVTNSERRISRQRAFLAPPGEARADWWMISEVARRLGHGDAFDYEHPAEIMAEHARLTACKNHGTRDLDLGGLAVQSRQQYENLAPTQWPVSADQPNGCPRLFENNRFYTPSGKARFVPIAPRGPARSIANDFPLRLNTGRVRDHWHTMTRTGQSPRLARHRYEPFVEVHPNDAERFELVAGDLASIRGEHGRIVVRVRLSEQQLPGNLFVPIHWNDQFASAARVGRLLGAVTDPHSGQPELKHAPVRIAPYRAGWYGFLLSRRPLAPDPAVYWSRSRGKGLWRYQLAGEPLTDEWLATARALLGPVSQETDRVEYVDPANQQYRAAHFIDNRLESCLYIAPHPDLPEYDWLEALFENRTVSGKERISLLAGKASGSGNPAGPTVCACFGVGRNTLLQAIEQQGLESVETIGQQLKAGTNCGSCLPEIKSLLEQSRSARVDRPRDTGNAPLSPESRLKSTRLEPH
ncbi:MAG: molybdopterin-dependent oxidoreductase [Pseudomonadota bacterium]|nr:molybdopterin-dependent oxidoreductase [Pseudomonadota bacterium]